MDRAIEGLSAGNDVMSSDGEKIGIVAAIRGSYLLVEKGLLFVTDYHVPMSAVARYDEDEEAVHLNVTRDEAMASGWDEHPDDPELDVTGGDTLLTGAAEMPDPGVIIETDDSGEVDPDNAVDEQIRNRT